jgi:hypothetical protein
MYNIISCSMFVSVANEGKQYMKTHKEESGKQPRILVQCRFPPLGKLCLLGGIRTRSNSQGSLARCDVTSSKRRVRDRAHKVNTWSSGHVSVEKGRQLWPDGGRDTTHSWEGGGGAGRSRVRLST